MAKKQKQKNKNKLLITQIYTTTKQFLINISKARERLKEKYANKL